MNQNLRFDPAIYLTKQFLAPERFGKPGFIQFAKPVHRGSEIRFRAGGRGHGVADTRLDSIRWLSGGEATSVYCTNQNNASMYQIEFSSGAVCNYFEYHNEDTFRSETPAAGMGRKGRHARQSPLESRLALGEATWLRCALMIGPRRSVG